MTEARDLAKKTEFDGTPAASRLTMTLNAYSTQQGQQPRALNCVVSQAVDNVDGEEAYERTTKAGIEPKVLDLGWCKDNPGTIVVVNKAGTGNSVQPSAEELAAVKEQVLYVDTGGSPALIKPGRFMVFQVVAGVVINIRAGADNTPYTVWVAPE